MRATIHKTREGAPYWCVAVHEGTSVRWGMVPTWDEALALLIANDPRCQHGNVSGLCIDCRNGNEDA